MVPNYTMIAEILYFAEGFKQAKYLANKTTKLYQLCSQQLQLEDHYDYGMRAIKAVIIMAGQILNDHKDEDECLIVIKAMKNTHLEKICVFS